MSTPWPDIFSGYGASRGGFTLVELLCVMAIMGLLLYVTLPITTSLQESNNIAFAGQTVADELAVAREYAASRNQSVYVRFIIPSGSAYQGYSALQIWRPDPDNPGGFLAVDRLVELPINMEVSSNATLSPLVTAATYVNTSNSMPGTSGAMPTGGSVTGNYVAFMIRPDGNVEVPTSPATVSSGADVAYEELPYYFLTILPVRYDSAGTLPKNYVTIQLNPDTANAQIFRP